jgi:osmoprotectant transport system permease protein
LELVFSSMALALLTGIPAGIALSRPGAQRSAEKFIQIFNIGNTIPSIAVLALALAAFGIGNGPTILALWLASLLPIVRNTYEGWKNVPAAMKEAARGIGMKPHQILLRGVAQCAAHHRGWRAYFAGDQRWHRAAVDADRRREPGWPDLPRHLPEQSRPAAAGRCRYRLLALVLDALVTSLSGFYLARRGLRT